MYSGDPITNTGWLQYLENPPCDIKMVHGSGTFSIAPLDTQRVIYAIIIGHGESRLESVRELKRNAHFVRNAFQTEFQLNALAMTETDFVNENQVTLRISAQLSGKIGISEVRAELYSYDNSLVHTIPLFDDGQHHDGQANDNIFGNLWQTTVTDAALYLNLNIISATQQAYLFQHCADNITLTPNRLVIASVDVGADHLNEDGRLNPGETARLNCTVQNNFPFDIGILNVWLTTDDPFVRIEPAHLFLNNIASGTSRGIPYSGKDQKTYFTIHAANDIPDTHTIYFDVSFVDNYHHVWYEKNYAKLKLSPMEYAPNQIIPGHVSGHSSAQFVISVMQPGELTGHSYAITVGDIDRIRQGFQLVDQTLGDTLLKNQLPPDEFALNVPLTDGFKVTKAYLPRGGMSGYYEDIPGGNPIGLKGFYDEGRFRDVSILAGSAAPALFQKVEFEFTNRIDSSGIVGTPNGQGAFQYLTVPTAGMHGFFPCAFNAWKIIDGRRAGKLNACFLEYTPYLPTYDETWNFGEWLYILASDYDSTGQQYLGQDIPADEVIYKINLSLREPGSVVDAGDRIIFNNEFRATNEDIWTFIPTNVKEPISQVPEAFALYQNYPNPFNPTTTISFSLDKPAWITLKIYNILGQEILELMDKDLASGIHSIQWDGKNAVGQQISSGLYFARLTNRNQTKLVKMVLIR